jgi:hypothetical protein
MFMNQPFYAILLGMIYIGIVYLFVRKEKKVITYSLTILSGLLQLSFLYLWLEKATFLMRSSNLGFEVYNSYLRFIHMSYFILMIPLVLICVWFGIKKIISLDFFSWFKILFSLAYIGALLGISIIGEFVFVLLYYGFAP